MTANQTLTSQTLRSTTVPTLILKPGKEKSLLRRHPWLYAQGVARIKGEAAAGDTVSVVAADGRWLAWASYSPDSAILARAWSFDPQTEVNAAWIAQRVARAVAARAGLAQRTDAIRLVFGEADGLPGVIADRYGSTVVIQLLSAGADRWRGVMVEALQQATGCETVYERSEGSARVREKLPASTGVLWGPEPPDLVAIQEDGVRLLCDVRKGHKTGHYIDQRDNRRLCGQLASGARVLNLFCYTGGFSMAALRGGAESVWSVDSSADALRLGQRHEPLNQPCTGQAHWLEADVFQTLKDMVARSESFDLIVLDPPKFAPSHRHVDKAARAYKEINLKAMRLLAPGGHLMSFSCSGAIDTDLFQKIVAGAVMDSGKDLQMIQRLGAGSDHPVLMTHPEGEYLKGLLLRAC